MNKFGQQLHGLLYDHQPRLIESLMLNTICIVIKPEVAGETLMGDWTLRAQVQFLFPTGG